MLTCIDVKFIFDSVHLDLSRTVNILQTADFALRVVLMFSGVGKQMVNAEFSRIYRFVKLLVNEGFLAVFLAVFAMLLAIISPSSSCSSYSWNE